MTEINAEERPDLVVSFYDEESEGAVKLGQLPPRSYFKTTEIHTFYLVGPRLGNPEHYDPDVYQVVFRYPSIENCYMNRENIVKPYEPTKEELVIIAPHVASGEFYV